MGKGLKQEPDNMKNSDFSKALLRWGEQHGRTSLPWQLSKTPYKVWVSEIMLQQTQVKTVVPYFRHFMKRFPSLTRLATAPRSEVLSCWAGLGYYRRAHNLHRAAKEIVHKHGRRFPREFSTLVALPGIGRSTAAAILALCYEKPYAILDGNVKRVLTRYFNIEGWPEETTLKNKLWALSESLLPQHRLAEYTQSLMDLGATVCTATNPRCSQCPLVKTCQAYALNVVAQRPQKKRRLIKPRQPICLLIAQHKNKVLLQKRPSQGIWSGLLCFPEFQSIAEATRWYKKHFKLDCKPTRLPRLDHHLTHLLLAITPIKITLPATMQKAAIPPQTIWCKMNNRLAIPTPVNTLLAQLEKT